MAVSFFVILLLPLVNAHIIPGNGFTSGAVHPLTGIDHLLDMIAVGNVSIFVSAQKWWRMPLIFVTVMVAGGIAGHLGVNIPFVEYGIALSVVLLGFAIAAAKRLSFFWSSFFIALFAFFHGHAHGTEMSAITDPAYFIIGFVLSTTALHLSGVAVGLFSEKSKRFSMFVRAAGMLMSSVGIYLLVTI